MKKPHYREVLCLSLAAAAIASGCGRWPATEAASALREGQPASSLALYDRLHDRLYDRRTALVAVFPAAEVVALLASAGGEDEVWGFLPKPTPSPSSRAPKEEKEKPRKARPEGAALSPRKRALMARARAKSRRPPRKPNELASGIVVRGGVLMTVSADQGDWGPAFAGGVGYRWAQGATSKRIFDFGLDFSSVERDDGLVSSKLWSLRGEVLFGDWSVRRRKTIVYVLGGAHALFADSEWKTVDRQKSSSATGFEVGVGIGSATGRWDLRAVYSFLAGSDNVSGNILLAAGFSL